MNRLRRLLAALMAFAVVSSLPVGVAAAAPLEGTREVTPISSCTTITSPGTYVLATDITDSEAGICIDIRSDDVVFDGRGLAIDGDGSNASTGIRVHGPAATSRVENVTVRDVTVTDWKDGIRYEFAIAGRIEDVLVKSNVAAGIRLRDAREITVTGSRLVENGGPGIRISAVDGLSVSFNVIDRNAGDGVRADTSAASDRNEDLTMVYNAVSDNGKQGINVYNASGVTVSHTLANRNGEDGADLHGVRNVTVAYAIANRNGDDGIDMDEFGNVRVEGTIANENGDEGFTFGGVSNGLTVTNSLAKHNSRTDDDGDGFDLSGVENARFENNVAAGNRHGFAFRGVENASLVTSVASRNDANGVDIESSSRIAIEHSAIEDNGVAGIGISGGSAPTVAVHGNVIRGNADFGVYTVGVVNATNNYWGAVNGPGSPVDTHAPFEDPTDTDRAADGDGDTVSESPSVDGESNVDFYPFLPSVSAVSTPPSTRSYQAGPVAISTGAPTSLPITSISDQRVWTPLPVPGAPIMTS